MGDGDDYPQYLKDRTRPGVYQRFLDAGGVPGQINTAWQMMQRQLQERLQRDSKSR